MIFKTIPQNGKSWQESLLYSLEFEQREGQVVVEIYDQLSSLQLGSIMLYNVKYAQVDIAPYIRSQKRNVPLAVQESIIQPSHDACRVVLRVMGEESESRLFFRSEIGTLQPQILSTITESGTIAVGEKIRLTIIASNSINLTLLHPTTGAFQRYEYFAEGVPCEVVLPIDAATVGDSIVLRVVCDGELVGLCRYRVVERDGSAVRLAWVNSKGGMECYTFPQSVKRSMVVKSEDVEGECGWYRRVASSTIVRRVMMLGATQSEMDGMLDILLSPKVCKCDRGEDMAVQLITDTILYDDHGRLRRLEFDIKEEWKGGVL